MTRERVLKRVLKRLREDVHLWLVYILAVVFLLWHLLHALHWIPLEPPEQGFLFFAVISILTLAADRIWETEETKERVEEIRAETREQVKEITTKLSRVYQGFFDRRISLRDRPSQSEEYDYLWGGYTGIYRVYNPSYRVENQVKEDEIVKIFVDRYQDSNFKEARYLFLTGDEAGCEDLKRFSKLMKRVQEQCPNVHKKILVKEINEKAGSACEMYLGKRYDNHRAVLELKAPRMHSEHGMPEYYLVIDDDEIVNHYVKAHFDMAWGGKTEDRDVFA